MISVPAPLTCGYQKYPYPRVAAIGKQGGSCKESLQELTLREERVCGRSNNNWKPSQKFGETNLLML